MQHSSSRLFRTAVLNVAARWRIGRVIALAAVALLASTRGAHADGTITTPGDHPNYRIELEPHVTLGWDNVYASSGVGVGGRFSIPVVQNGFIPSLNNTIAVSFGVELLHYGGCYRYSTQACGANYLFFPIAMQWNFFVARQWSVFGEPGFTIFQGFFDKCPSGALGCVDAPTLGWRPTLAVGGRYHLSEHVALTARIGYPAFTLGASFM